MKKSCAIREADSDIDGEVNILLTRVSETMVVECEPLLTYGTKLILDWKIF